MGVSEGEVHLTWQSFTTANDLVSMFHEVPLNDSLIPRLSWVRGYLSDLSSMFQVPLK